MHEDLSYLKYMHEGLFYIKYMHADSCYMKYMDELITYKQKQNKRRQMNKLII